MKPIRLTAALAAAILTAVLLTPAAEAQERIEVPWPELGQALAGHIVSTVLPDGTILRGRVLDVSAEQLRFDADKTSNPSLYPKGELSLAKSQLRVFSYTAKRGYWRAAGAAIGAAGTVAAVAVPLTIAKNEGAEDTALGYALSGGLGAGLGYLIGNAADKREITVVVAQD
jgi:hypothetical protein